MVALNKQYSFYHMEMDPEHRKLGKLAKHNNYFMCLTLIRKFDSTTEREQKWNLFSTLLAHFSTNIEVVGSSATRVIFNLTNNLILSTVRLLLAMLTGYTDMRRVNEQYWALHHIWNLLQPHKSATVDKSMFH